MTDDDPDISAKSSRLLGSQQGTDFFLATGEDGRQLCIVIYSSDEKWVTGCGENAYLEMTSEQFEARTLPDGVAPMDGAEWVIFDDQVAVRATGG